MVKTTLLIADGLRRLLKNNRAAQCGGRVGKQDRFRSRVFRAFCKPPVRKLAIENACVNCFQQSARANMLIIRCVLFLLLIIAPTLFPTETWAQDTLILPPGLEAPCTNMLSPIWYHGMPFDDVDIEIMQHGFKVTLKKDHARHPSIVSFEIFRREQVNTEHVCSALDDRFLVICTETKEQSTAPPLEAWKNWFLTRRDPKKLSEMWVAISNLSSGKSETFHGSPDQRGDAHKQPWSGEHDPAESLILAKPIDTAPWWFRPAGAVSCFLLLALLGFVFNPRRDAIRTMLLLAGASVGTRCIIPYFPIKMKSQILTSLSNIRRDVVSSPFEAFLHFVKNTLGDHMEAFVLPFRFVGAALPILTYLLALRIYGDKKIALTGALVVLLSPVTMGQSSSIIYTQLASPLFFLALLIGQTAVEKNIKIQIPAIIGASLSLVGAMLVKEQFLSLPPLFLVMQGLFIAFSSMEKRKKVAKHDFPRFHSGGVLLGCVSFATLFIGGLLRQNHRT